MQNGNGRFFVELVKTVKVSNYGPVSHFLTPVHEFFIMSLGFSVNKCRSSCSEALSEFERDCVALKKNRASCSCNEICVLS